MKVNPKYALLLLSGLIFLVADWVPDVLLRYGLGSIVGSVTIFIGVLYVTMYDSLVGLAFFLAVAALYLEHRRRILDRLRDNMYASKTGSKGTVSEVMKGSPPLSPNEVHPRHEVPEYEVSSFEPEEKSDVVESSGLDGKTPLETVGQDTDAVSSFLQEKGLANIM
jgi:hypothetical protein